MDLKIKKKTIVINAPIWRRIGAFLLDYFLVESIILFPFSSVLSKVIMVNNLSELMSLINTGTINFKLLIAVTLSMSIIAMLYFVILESRFGQTVGKMLMDIHVVSIIENTKEQSDFAFGIKHQKIMFGKISLFRSFKRSLSIAFLYVFPFITLIDFIYALFNQQNQRIFEVFSNTKTIYLTQI